MLWPDNRSSWSLVHFLLVPLVIDVPLVVRGFRTPLDNIYERQLSAAHSSTNVRNSAIASASYGNLTDFVRPILSIPDVSNVTSSPTPRYGHSAVYLADQTTLLLIGGQLENEEFSITREVLSLNMSENFVSSAVSLISSTSASPSSASKTYRNYSLGLPAHAWAASAVDVRHRSWLIGGVTEDCTVDSDVYVYNTSTSKITSTVSSTNTSWSVPEIFSQASIPPRRRQAQAVSVVNGTAGGTDIWVFAGIAEQYTCSREMNGYLGIDRWSTETGEIEVFPWTQTSTSTPVAINPPVSDYSATLLRDGRTIVLVGGQSSDGDLVPMDQILVFDVLSRRWSLETASGSFPPARMGHSAVLLSSGSVLIQGGATLDRSSLSSLFILTPPPNVTDTLQSESMNSTMWVWTALKINPTPDTASLEGAAAVEMPSLAWHTATIIPTISSPSLVSVVSQIVVAFGVNTADGNPSSDIYFLTIDPDEKTYTWSATYQPTTTSPYRITANHVAVIRAIVNPKASIAVSGQTLSTEEVAPPLSTLSTVDSVATTRSPTSSKQTSRSSTTSVKRTSSAQTSVQESNQSETPNSETMSESPPTTTISNLASPSILPTQSSTTSASISRSTSTLASLPSPSSGSHQQGSLAAVAAKRTKTIATAVGCILAVVLVTLVSYLLWKKSVSNKRRWQNLDANEQKITREKSGPPPVSQMIYSRQVSTRKYTVSSDDTTVAPVLASIGGMSSVPSTKGKEAYTDHLGRLRDPFSDVYINENTEDTLDGSSNNAHGLGSIAQRDRFTEQPLVPPQQGVKGTLQSSLSATVSTLGSVAASVFSVPYLNPIRRASSVSSSSTEKESYGSPTVDEHGDNYTAFRRERSLRSKKHSDLSHTQAAREIEALAAMSASSHSSYTTETEGVSARHSPTTSADSFHGELTKAKSIKVINRGPSNSQPQGDEMKRLNGTQTGRLGPRIMKQTVSTELKGASHIQRNGPGSYAAKIGRSSTPLRVTNADPFQDP